MNTRSIITISGNGTFLNGKRVAERSPLGPNDRLKLGPVLLRFETGTANRKEIKKNESKLNVQISIGLSGRVKNVAVQGPPNFRALEPCIREVVARWMFPPSSEEYGTEFVSSFQGSE